MATVQGRGGSIPGRRSAVAHASTSSSENTELRSNRSGLNAEHPGSSGRGGTLPEEGEKFSKADAWGQMAGATSKAAIRAQEKRRIAREARRPAFYRYSEGVARGLYVDDGRDDLMVGLYHVEGGCSFEFKIEPTLLGGKRGLLLQLHDDSFEALLLFSDLFRWMGKVKPKTLDDVQTWLTENGYVNCIAGHKAQAVRA